MMIIYFHCHYSSPKKYYRNSQKVLSTPIHNFSNNLQTLIFSGCVPPENQFRFILDHFPHLKTLIIEESFSSTFHLQQDVEPYFLFDMPNISLKHIKIGLHTGFPDDMIVNSIYIKLATSDDQNTRYFFIVNGNGNKFQKIKLLKNLPESQY
jgi:hypothetical protein